LLLAGGLHDEEAMLGSPRFAFSFVFLGAIMTDHGGVMISGFEIACLIAETALIGVYSVRVYKKDQPIY
jgi:hypothetical protein